MSSMVPLRLVRGVPRRSVTLAVVAVVLLGYAVATVVRAGRSSADEPPPGGLVPSVANVGWTQGEFSVSHDGAAQYSMPLWVSAGRGSVTPKLSLNYDSRGGNGLLGVGWSLTGLPAITWCPRTHAHDGFADGVYFDGASPLCLGGSRLMPLSEAPSLEREYRVEHDPFAKVVAFGAQDNVPNSFKVWTKDGNVLTFGATPDSRVQAYRLQASGGSLVRVPGGRVTTAWQVNAIADRNGNTASVEYIRSEGDQASLWFVDVRPRFIRYAPNRQVEFVYESRTDVIDGFGRGVLSRLAHRLKSVKMSGGPQGGSAVLLREYRFAYRDTASTITGRSLLSSVTACDGAGTCMLSLPFTYSTGAYDFEVVETNVTEAGQPHPEGFPTVDADNRIIVGDVDGDGRSDLIYPDTRPLLTPTSRQQWKIRKSTGNGFGPAVAAGFQVPNGKFGVVRPIDFDRDGRLDVMVEVPDSSIGGSGWKLFRSDGTAFVPYGDNIGWRGPLDDENDPVYFADIDGNGMPDFMTAPYEVTGPDDNSGEIDGSWVYRLNRGTEAGGRFAPEVDTRLRNPLYPNNNRVFDPDGDGRAQMSGLGLNAAGAPEVETFNASSPMQDLHFGDVNGDGLEDDIVAFGAWRAEQPPGQPLPPVQPGRLEARINSGNGFAPSSPSPDFDSSVLPNGTVITDFNNDGRDDVLSWRNTGAQVYVWRDGAFVRDPRLDVAVGIYNAHGWGGTQVLDVDGDGAMDIVYPHDGHLRLLRRQGGVPDRLIAVGNALFSARVEFTYSTLGDRQVHTPGPCAYSLTCPAYGGSVVSQHRVATFAGGDVNARDVFRHTYEHARVDLRGRGWLGFAKHTVIRSATGAATVTEFDNTTSVTVPRPGFANAKAFPFAGIPKKITYTVSDGHGREHRRTVTSNNVFRRLTAGSYTVEPQTVTTVEQERAVGAATWQTLRNSTVQTTFDQFGNKDLIVSSTVGGRRLTEDPTYRNDAGAWLLGLATRKLSTSCTPGNVCKTRETTHDYDANGNRTLTVVEPNRPAMKLSTVTAYGAFGTVNSLTQTDGAGQSRRTTFEYDADRLHPTATINAAGHRTESVTHSGLGVPISATGPNGIGRTGVDKVTYRHDGFGRLRETHRSDGGFEKISHVSFGVQAIGTEVSGGWNGIVELDQLGRERRRRTETFNGAMASIMTIYDSLGRVSRVSRPTGPGETAQFTVTTYDNLDRIRAVTRPDAAAVRHSYVGREKHTFDAKNVESYTVTTVDGDVESSYQDDPMSTGWLRTRFEYGPFGELTKSVAPDGTQQTMRYDVVGRQERHVDPSTGTTDTTFNAFGEVLTTTDANNNTVAYTYDVLGRVKTATSPDGVLTNTWDTAANGKGKLAKARSADGVLTAHTYDEQSKPATTTWTIAGNDYQVAYDYDNIGRPESITYPRIVGAPAETPRLTINHVYNVSGYHSEIRDAAAPPAALPLWTAQARDASNQLTKERYGNRVVTDRTYEPTTGLMTNVKATGPGQVGVLSNITYTYDDNDNVIRRVDAINQRAEAYDYDELNRIDRWAGAPPNSHGTLTIDANFRYDKLGNLIRERVARTAEGGPQPMEETIFTYGQNGAPPHALSGRNGQLLYGYDDAGRQTSGPQRTVTYTMAGLPKTLTWGTSDGQAKQTTFRYDATNARVFKQDNSHTLISVPGLLDRRSPAGTGGNEIHNIHHIVVDGRVVAQVNRVQAAGGGPVTDTRVLHLHQDLQGSTVLVTNPAGRPADSEDSLLRELFYDPFGRRIDADFMPRGNNGNGSVARFGYTGHEHDDEFGLINMKGRM